MERHVDRFGASARATARRVLGRQQRRPARGLLGAAGMLAVCLAGGGLIWSMSPLGRALAQEQGVEVAILKARSPACGPHSNYDGSFSKRLVGGSGVAAALLRRHGIAVFSDEELDAAAAWIAEHDV